MAGKEQPRLKLLYLLQLLEEESDEVSGVTMTDILDYLKQKGITAERKSIYRDIALLGEFGYKIEKNNRRPPEYCLVSRHFELAELKLLVDAIQSAHFISASMTDQLIRKLEDLTSRSKAEELHRQVHYADRVKTENSHVYYTTGTIHDAIHQGSRITFQYMDYTPDKKTQLRHQGAIYEVSPYALVWNEDKYYLYAYSERDQSIRTYRLDRMKNVTGTDIPATPKPKDFSATQRLKKEFSMYSGESIPLDMRFHKDLINPVIDRFGTQVSILSDDQDHFVVHAPVDVSPVFYSWLFQFGGRGKILKPARIAEEYKAMLESVLEKG